MEFIKNVLSYAVIVWLVLPGGIRTEFLDKSGICKVANSYCETRYWCKEGFTEVNQFCLGKIDTQCSMTTDCIPDAICANFSGRMYCACRDGFKAELNKKECRLKVGSPCNVTAAQYCIHNAVCDVTLALANAKKAIQQTTITANV
ncbi:hypothetical protein DPMN_138514 [Dreissena polymorpha]|uniref:EGF-like domain-containing protein n=1 Tax=Dreissena polymorpha TaxID=45954 RepID=A0A9D4G421_DREPO|nr:hypothetical protein DPMN_138514 [Dreissena polymorpha]